MSFGHRYDQIKREINRTECQPRVLAELKQEYHGEIASKRKHDNINNVAELLRILERRDCVSADNLDCLCHILRSINRQDLLPLIRSPVNPVQRIQNNTTSQTVRSNIVPRDVKDRAYIMIARKIGKNWKDFARHLKVPEGEIDDWDTNNNMIYDKAFKVLIFHESNCDALTWQTKLLEALSSSRRNDLYKEVQGIFDMFGQPH